MIGKSPAGSIGRWGSNITASITTDTSVATWAVEDLSSGSVVFAGAGGRLSGDSGVFNWDPATNVITLGGMVAMTPDNSADIGSSTGTRPRNVIVGTSLWVGNSVAASGAIRLPNNQYIVSRNAGNTSDVGLIACDTSNRLTLELNTQSLFLQNASTQATVSSTGVAAALPLLPMGYLQVTIGGTARVMPYYNASS